MKNLAVVCNVTFNITLKSHNLVYAKVFKVQSSGLTIAIAKNQPTVANFVKDFRKVFESKKILGFTATHFKFHKTRPNI